MTHLIIIGLLLGWGAAIPIGPLNIEIIRRNLRFGFFAGIGVGLGASSGDITYLALLSAGMLSLFNTVPAQQIFGIIGGIILAWFGYKSFFQSTAKDASEKIDKSTKSILSHIMEGYILVLVNPYTILFWLSVSSQLAAFGGGKHANLLALGLGVMLGVISWVICFNCIISKLRHKLSSSTIHTINRVGGIIILSFALFFVYNAIHVLFTH